jgi:integrase
MAQGITERHARACRHGNGRCTCTPTFKAQVWDAKAGKRITETFPTITAARQWRQDGYAALRAGTLTADRGPTLQDAADEWLDAARAGIVRARGGAVYKPSTRRAYKQHLNLRVLPALGQERLGEITLPMLQHYVDRLAADDVAAGTIAMTIMPLRAILGRAERLGVVSSNPTRGLALPTHRAPERRIASPGEIERVLENVAARDRALWATAFLAGLRRGELRGLRWEDIDLAGGIIHVRRGWDQVEGEIAPKSEAGRRRVPIPAALRDHLLEHRLATEEDIHVFGAGRARWMIERGTRAQREAGIEPFAIHECRHTYASLMIAAGVNAKALSEFMGHASIAVTLDLYGHLMPGSHDEAAGLLDAFLARSAGTETVSTAAPTAPHPEQSRS